jgi:hypothetical protein
MGITFLKLTTSFSAIFHGCLQKVASAKSTVVGKMYDQWTEWKNISEEVM